jgi:non-specific protein-tyrosine kinase
MDPISFAQLLLRRWWLLLLCAIVGVGLAYYFATSRPPAYVSTVSLQLNPAGKTPFLPYSSEGISRDTSPVTAVAASYNEVLRSRAFGEVVVQQLQLPVSPDAIGASLSTVLVPNTNILRLNVIWDNPSDAQQLAQNIAQIFIIENQRRQESQPDVQAQLGTMEQSASDLQDRMAPLQQQEQRLNSAIARGDLSGLSELTSVGDRLAALESSRANLLIEISRLRSSFDTAVIVDNATPGGLVNTTPLSQALLFGLLGGLGVAIVLSLVLEYLGDAVRTRRDVVEVAGVPPLARVGHTRGAGLVMRKSQASTAAEAFRSMRASLRLAAPARSLDTLVVTSAGPREGKTFVASNLAIALAQSGKRVLLVDADLRRPSIHTWFNVANDRGLTDSLSGSEHPAVLASGLENLWLLPSGPRASSPSELLGSEALSETLHGLSQRWDMVILDSAPVGPVSDTLLLANQASGALLVARSGRTRRSALHGALAALSATGRPIVGIVLNDEHTDPLSRFSRYDYSNHGYWSDASLPNPDQRVHALQNGTD